MLRHALARVLHAVADRIEPDKPEPTIQYVYVHSAPPTSPSVYPQQWWQSPITYSAGSN
jgi:hypothetical protein